MQTQGAGRNRLAPFTFAACPARSIGFLPSSGDRAANIGNKFPDKPKTDPGGWACRK